MKKSSTIIANFVNGLFMKQVMKAKGWTKQDAVYAVTDYLTSGTKLNVKEYFEQYAPSVKVVH
jgi:hypothetical protein